MSGIKDVERNNHLRLETVKRRTQREINAIESNHKSYKKEIDKAHDLELADLRTNNQIEINKTVEKKEKVLNELKTNLDQTKEFTDKQLKDLKNQSQREKLDLHKKFTVDRDRINQNHQLHLDENNDRFNDVGNKVTEDGKRRLDDITNTMNDKINETQKKNHAELDEQKMDFANKYRSTEQNNIKMKDQQDKFYKKERISTNLRQQAEIRKMGENHKSHFDLRDTEYRKGFKEQDRFFEKKFSDQLNRHNLIFKELETKNNKVVENLKSSLTKEIAKIAEKNDDQFYQFETLKPRLKQFKDHVEIQVEVPDHSKQDLQLTIHGKEAILNFNRRYNDASKSAEGTINKINKVETFTTRLPTDDALNARSVKSSYENGTMTYVIKKS